MERERLYDFLFDRDFPSWFCNAAKRLNAERNGQEFFMQLHTGESQAKATPNWDWEQRRKLGQVYLVKLATDYLNTKDDDFFSSLFRIEDYARKLRTNVLKHVELDGYKYKDGHLESPEADVLDAQEEHGVLESLYSRLALDNADTAMHCLALSEKNWLSEQWDDCIANSRRFLEAALREVAVAHSSRMRKTPLPQATYTRPVRIREYLQSEGLVEPQEMTTIKETYGLLSQTGSHPYIAAKDQARLLRQVALIYSQFIMLRLEGCLASNRA